MTRLPPAPDAVLHLVKCNCKKDRCANNRCKCRKAGLQCTDLCGCADNDCCNNVPDEEENSDDEDDMEEYADEVDEEVMDWEDA